VNPASQSRLATHDADVEPDEAGVRDNDQGENPNAAERNSQDHGREFTAIAYNLYATDFRAAKSKGQTTMSLNQPEWNDAPQIPPCLHTPAEFSLELVSLFCRERVGFRFTPQSAFDVIDLADDDPATFSRAKAAFEKWRNASEQRTEPQDKPEQLMPGMQPGMQQRGF